MLFLELVVTCAQKNVQRYRNEQNYRINFDTIKFETTESCQKITKI